ncbi:SufE family protein [Glycocaulis profundi]|nr:SufE family protein [Glycocaulis profundi]
MTVQNDIDALVDEFDLLDDWEQRYRHLIDLGQEMDPLPEAEKTEASKVKGCVSQVWLVMDREGEALVIRGDSDAHIVKGLVALLVRLYSGRSPGEITAIDPRAVLSRIGLAEHLSPQRSNGLSSMVARIREEAAQAA